MVSQRAGAFFVGLLFMLPALRAEDAVPAPETPSAANEETEERGIIPAHDDVHSSPQAITPISTFPEKPGYLQALDEFQQELKLWHSGYAEAASDVGLLAYDDLISVHVPGMKKAQRHKLIYQAALVYVQASIQAARDYLVDQGHTPEAVKEARERLDDVRDVSRNYQGLSHLIDEAQRSL